MSAVVAASGRLRRVRDLLLGPVEEVARRLLGATVTSDLDGERVAARIVEVEAYGGEDDPASHAYRGRTARNASMFAQPGTADANGATIWMTDAEGA